ncbi:protein kinase, partial [bacterium]|nr:protein kinase [bacterium]
MIGKNVLHYKILKKLGEGGMGVVYKAHDTKLKRYVALKFLPLHITASEEEKARFEREAQAAAGLDHPNICTVHEINEADGQMFIAMAFVDGQSLHEMGEAIGDVPLRIEKVIDYAIQIAEGLQAAHEKEIVHRDIKPANILITEKGQVRITDFGLAKLGGRTQLTKEGTSMGTVAYMSPEQTHGATVDHRTDIWAFGVVLYEMITGQLPFVGGYDQAVIYSIMNENPEPPTALRSGVPMELEQIVLKALAKTPAERYQTVGKMLADLKALQGGSESRAGLGTRRDALTKRSRYISIIGVLLIFAFSVYFTLTKYLGSNENTSPSVDTTSTANRVAVFPFSVRGAPEYEYLGEGMADLLSGNLDGAGGLRSINQNALLKVLSRQPGSQVDLDNAGQISEHLAAGRYVLGNILEAGGRLRITASLYQVDLGTESAASLAAEGPADEIFKMTDDLTAKIIAAISHEPAERLTRLATRTTDSFAALKAYLEGESYRKSGRIQDAVSAYQRAVSEDTTFALAYYRLTEMAGYSPTSVNSQETLNSARRHAAQLSERNRLLIDAFYHSRRGNFIKTEELYRNIVSLYPDEVEAWVTLGTIQWQTAGRAGASLEEARKTLERAVYYDPQNLPAVPFLWIISIWERDQARSDSLAERLNVLVPTGEKSIQTRTWLAFSKGDAAAQNHIIEEARGANSFEVRLTSTFLARMPTIHTIPQQFSNTVRFIQLLTEPARSVEDRFSGHMILADLHITKGSWRDARTELQRAESLKPVEVLPYR